MFSKDDDEPEDPRRFRRTLVPLDIEDAEKPPSFARRVAGIFRKKPAGGPDEAESLPPGPGTEPPADHPPEGTSPPAGSLPEDFDQFPDDGETGSNL